MAKENKRSLIWTVFTKTAHNRAKCNLCAKELSYIGGSTSNLSRHLRTAHPKVKLKAPHYEESEATTIIATAQTSSDGECIATIDEPFEMTSEVPDECEDTAPVLEVQDEQPLQTDKRKRSECWSIFRKLDDTKVCCRYCGNTLSTPKGYTSNLKRHVKFKHPSLYASLRAKEIEKKKAMTPGQTSVAKRNPDRISQSSMSLFSVAQGAEMPQDMLKIMEDTQEKIGFVPNAYQALSHRPNEMRVFLTYYDTIMEDRLGSHLTKCDKEMILIAVSAFNKCKYFIIAHSGLFRIYSQNKFLADQIAANWETADIDERQRCILQFAMKVTKCEALMESDFKDLEIYGLDSEDAWDIGSIVSFCSLSNRMAFLTNMAPNEQFYSLGRTEK